MDPLFRRRGGWWMERIGELLLTSEVARVTFRAGSDITEDGVADDVDDDDNDDRFDFDFDSEFGFESAFDFEFAFRLLDDREEDRLLF